MESRGIKGKGEAGLDANRPTKKRRLEDYRKEAGLSPAQNTEVTTDNYQILKRAWAVDQARSKLDHYGELHNDQAENARGLFKQLKTYMYTGEKEKYLGVLTSMEKEEKNKYIDTILKEMRIRFEKGEKVFDDIISVNSIEKKYESVISRDIEEARELFNNLANSIEKRNIENFNQIKGQLKLKRKTNGYIEQGMNICESAFKKSDEEIVKEIAEKVKREAEERAKLHPQDDSMDMD